MVYRIAVSQVGKKDVAEDIFQDVFLQLIRYLDKLKSEEHVKHWLIRTTINRSKSILSSSWYKKTTGYTEEELSCPNIFPSDIYFMILKLPPKLKSVTFLYYYEKYDVNEIADMLKTKSGTVKSRLFKARALLKLQLEGDEENEV